MERPHTGMGRPRVRAALVALVAVLGVTAAGAGAGSAGTERGVTAGSPLGKTTLEQRIVPAGDGTGYRRLKSAPGEGYTVRESMLGKAKPRRAGKRRSLAYFGQLSDFQLADEESPARVESLDPLGDPVSAAFRPWEAVNPHIDDAMIRQFNELATRPPVVDRRGRPRAMSFTIGTGDLADSQQLNETRWVRTLLDGGRLDPNSGIDPAGYVNPTCPPVGVPGAAEAAAYTGVQDYDDYAADPDPYFYDPDEARGTFAGFPTYPGLMDEAQKPFTAAGLDMPSYIAIGNHDGLVQGNQAATGPFEQVATGCTKVLGATGTSRSMAAALSKLTPAGLRRRGPAVTALVPPDPARRFVSKEEYKRVFEEGEQSDGHGFGLVDPADNEAADGAIGYYSFEPVKNLRMIALDTVSEGGVIGPSSDGNVDDPQFRWLEGELERAERRRERVILFSHHAIRSLTADVPDEAAGSCTGVPDSHGHDSNPGCDVDPRSSTPIHLGEDLTELLLGHPNVIAWVAGHSHVNDVEAYEGERGGFWMIRSAAEADWPQQGRLIQLFDNRDGTLSFFGTVIDHAGPVEAAADGTSAGGLSVDELASIGRNLAYNDNQSGARECEPTPCGEGKAQDRNVELLIRDPLRPCTDRVVGADGRDTILGRKSSQRVLGRAGDDRLFGGGAIDCVVGGRGSDLIGGGPRRDRLKGQGGADRIQARDGERDRVDCGIGSADIAIVDGRDRVRRCEIVRVRG